MLSLRLTRRSSGRGRNRSSNSDTTNIWGAFKLDFECPGNKKRSVRGQPTVNDYLEIENRNLEIVEVHCAVKRDEPNLGAR
jgi:hypothetical protein